MSYARTTTTRGARSVPAHDPIAALEAIYASDQTARAQGWRAVTALAKRALPGCHDEDARQDALLRAFESVHALRATHGPGIAAWVRTICRHAAIARFRARRVMHVPLDLVEHQCAAVDPAWTSASVDIVIEHISNRIDTHVARMEPEGDRRERRRLQALVALRRTVMGESLDDVARALSLNLSDDLLAKWVERGRPVLVAALADADPEVEELYAGVAALAMRRRADAGRPRPLRRRHLR